MIKSIIFISNLLLNEIEWSSNVCASNFDHFGRNAQKLPILLELLAINMFTMFPKKLKNSIDFSAKNTS